jgi:hypothetical protein
VLLPFRVWGGGTRCEASRVGKCDANLISVGYRQHFPTLTASTSVQPRKGREGYRRLTQATKPAITLRMAWSKPAAIHLAFAARPCEDRVGAMARSQGRGAAEDVEGSRTER